MGSEGIFIASYYSFLKRALSSSACWSFVAPVTWADLISFTAADGNPRKFLHMDEVLHGALPFAVARRHVCVAGRAAAGSVECA